MAGKNFNMSGKIVLLSVTTQVPGNRRRGWWLASITVFYSPYLIILYSMFSLESSSQHTFKKLTQLDLPFSFDGTYPVLPPLETSRSLHVCCHSRFYLSHSPWADVFSTGKWRICTDCLESSAYCWLTFFKHILLPESEFFTFYRLHSTRASAPQRDLRLRSVYQEISRHITPVTCAENYGRAELPRWCSNSDF